MEGEGGGGESSKEGAGEEERGRGEGRGVTGKRQHGGVRSEAVLKEGAMGIRRRDDSGGRGVAFDDPREKIELNDRDEPDGGRREESQPLMGQEVANT